jgi:hypothetical protein
MVAALFSAAAFPALAGDVPLPPLTPKREYLVMTQEDATSTSNCIGNPVTPRTFKQKARRFRHWLAHRRES